jgi:hypothetical protein
VAGQQLVFDGNTANKPVEINIVTAVPDTVLLENGYNAQMTLDAGVVLETANGFTFNPGTTAKIDFVATTSKLQADHGNSSFANFQFTDQRGTVLISSGTLTVGNTAVSDTYSNFLIGGILTVNNSAVATFHKGAGITIASGGSMTVAATDGTVLSDNGDGGIIENWGTFNYTGTATSTTIADMAFLNHGQATFDTGTFMLHHTSAATNNADYEMAFGMTTLKNGVYLSTPDGYYQIGGVLSVADTIKATLAVVGNGKAEIDGGSVQLGTATTFGSLWVNGDLTFNGGEFDAKISGAAGGPGKADEIEVNSKLTILGASKLVVTAIGPVAAGQTWTIFDTTANSIPIVGDFLLANKTLPAGVQKFPKPQNLPFKYSLWSQ